VAERVCQHCDSLDIHTPREDSFFKDQTL
jgi:hypothetical protein